ncbi:MAG: GNAT family N-acetyltransferase [Actinomycetes bacterium]
MTVRPGAVVRPLDQPGDLGWVLMAHGEVYTTEFGWSPTFEALVARIVADYAAGHDPSREAGWIAEVEGVRVGCILCVAEDEETAKLRALLVHPQGRGLGLGATLVDGCIEFARQAGYRRMRLWTTDPLVAARHLYVTRGFSLVREVPHHDFGPPMLGQTYELDLRHAPSAAASGS